MRKKKGLLLLKKKKQKDFNNFLSRIECHRDSFRIKVFWFFFSKKNILFL